MLRERENFLHHIHSYEDHNIYICRFTGGPVSIIDKVFLVNAEQDDHIRNMYDSYGVENVQRSYGNVEERNHI